MSGYFFKIGFGTWMMGGGVEPDPNNDDETDIAIIRYAIESGVKHIDTAELYANGRTEELVGQAIAPYNRAELFIASKVSETHLHYKDVLESCEKSLDRLGIDELDLYYVHWPNPEIPVEETAKALNELMKKGLIRNVGISNASVETLQAYGALLDKPIFAAQGHYNLIVREPERRGVLKYCRENDIHFVAWRPIQLPSEKFDIHGLYERGAYPLLDEMADKYYITNAQMAVKWLIAQDNVSTIFKSSKPKHVLDILDVQEIDVSSEDLQNLTDNFPRQEDFGFTTTAQKPLI